ncbi:MAG: rod shape-determining protein [Armatimonadetes bacterium]|nr:rod shape-determining protein [Armatimonadota bacterium]
MNLPWAEELAIDVGTANLHISLKQGGVVVREPALVAYSDGRRRAVAFGLEARRLQERAVEGVQVVQPIRHGVVADFDAAVTMLRHFIHQALGRRPMLNPVVVTACPTAATAVEQRALQDAIRAAGGGRILMIQKALAAAIGAGVSLDAVETQFVVDIGAGASDIGAVSMGMLTAGVSPPVAGDRIDQAIVRHVKRTQNIRVSATTAEEMKIQIGTVDPLLGANGNGFSTSTDELQAYDVRLDDIPAVVAGALRPVYDEIAWMIEELPPRPRAELGANGLVLTGGTALLKGLADHMADWLGLPVRVATDPMSCTILGLQSIVNDMQALSLGGRRFNVVASVF